MPIKRVIEPNTILNEDGAKFGASILAKEIGNTSLLMSLNPWHTEAVDELITLLDPAEAFGFFPGFPTQIPLDFTKHSSELSFDVVKKILPDLCIEDFSYPPVIQNQFREFAVKIRKMIPAEARTYAVHGDTKPEKMWMDARFVELINWLLERDQNAFIFDLGLNNIGGSYFLNNERVISCRELILPSAIELVGSMDFFVGVDSCFLHAADMYRVPGVGLFGPTEPHEFGFRFGPHRHVSGNHSMNGISITSVISAVIELENSLATD